VLELIEKQSGTLIKSLAAVLIAVLIVWFGLRPAVRALTQQSENELQMMPETPFLPMSEPPSFGDMDTMPGVSDFQMGMNEAEPEAWPEQSMLDDMARNNARSPQRRLEHLVQLNEDQAVAVLRAWMREGKPA
jgi:flagellar M-ring protein FliF